MVQEQLSGVSDVSGCNRYTPKRTVQLLPTPPLPTHTCMFPGTHQVPPDLHLYPSCDHREAASGMPDAKVIHPASQDWVDLPDYRSHRLADMASKDLFELRKEGRSLFQPGRKLRPPLPVTAWNEAVFLRNEKLPPATRSTVRLLSSLTSTRSFANSSRNLRYGCRVDQACGLAR
jgi:hypothetical protein